MTGIAFVLNGAAVKVTVPTEAATTWPLIHALRNDLGQTGTRFGCGQEHCGACRIEVDGALRYACTLPLAEVAGRAVGTVEGLPEEPVGRALLAGFEAERAGQCGYCLSGILVAARALLRDTPDPDAARIRAALDGHLCRCGAHPGIVRAILRAAADLRQERR